MHVHCRCHHCQALFRMDAQFVGRKVRCPKCQTVMVLTATGGTNPPGDRPSTGDSRKSSPSTGNPVRSPAAAVPSAAHKRIPIEPLGPAQRIAARRSSPWMAWAMVATALFALAVTVGILLAAQYITQRPGTLLVELPAGDHPDYGVDVDGQRMRLGKERPVRLDVAPGKHQLVVQRRGYPPFQQAIEVRAGRETVVTPKWQSVKSAGQGRLGGVQWGSDVVPVGYDDWLQDWDKALRLADERDVPLLVAVVCSDADGPSQMLHRQVFASPEFRAWADQHVVRVVLDFPDTQAGEQRVANRARNGQIVAEYSVEHIPTLLWVDAQGRPMAKQQELSGLDWSGFQDIEQQVRQGYDAFVGARAAALDEAGEQENRLEHARTAVRWIMEQGAGAFYVDELARLAAVGEQLDGMNQAGVFEVLYAALWEVRLDQASADQQRSECLDLVDQMHAWREHRSVKDHNLAVHVRLACAGVLAGMGELERAAEEIRAASGLHPSDPKLASQLKYAAHLLSGTLTTGTGFVVAPGGYVLTNEHVIRGTGTPKIRLPESADNVPAQVVARDEERDMALLKVDDPRVAALPPVPVVVTAPGRGVAVATLGYALGGEMGEGLKLTQGSISGLPDQTTNGMLLLDMRINPGNSGGPLCDVRGQVIGMVTAKSYSDINVDSYGLARPAKELDQFLKKHVPDYTSPAPSEEPPGDWAQVDRRVSPSVVMVVTVE